jgi:hypothetical protein
MLALSIVLLFAGCGTAIDEGDGNNGVETVSVKYEVTGDQDASILIPDNDNNTTLYFPGSSVPWTHDAEEEEYNHVFLTVIYKDSVIPANLIATIYRGEEVFQTNSQAGLNINFTIEGYLDR